MRVHIWCPRASDSATRIRDSLRGYGITAFKSPPNLSRRRQYMFLHRVRRGDLWVNWGPPYSPEYYFPEMVVELNKTPWINKQEQLLKLAEHGIPCPEVYDGPGNGRLGRSIRHQGGYDLLHNTGRDYWTQKLEFSREVRVHIYRGMSIHAGLKVPRDGMTVHPWIRVYNSGWKIDYSHATRIAQSRRDLARDAVAVLGLDFGAVDIGIIQGKKMAVIEVNTAPGLDEGASVEAYVRHFMHEGFDRERN